MRHIIRRLFSKQVLSKGYLMALISERRELKEQALVLTSANAQLRTDNEALIKEKEAMASALAECTAKRLMLEDKFIRNIHELMVLGAENEKLKNPVYPFRDNEFIQMVNVGRYHSMLQEGSNN